jgi:hypothetical protein
MTPEIRTKILISRSRDYFDILRTTLFVLAAIAAVIHLGPGGFSLPLAMLAIATTAYGVLAGGVALDDIINLRADMDEDFAQTSYGQGVSARNIPAMKMVSTVLIGLVGLAELLAIVF